MTAVLLSLLNSGSFHKGPFIDNIARKQACGDDRHCFTRAEWPRPLGRHYFKLIIE